MTQGRDKLDVSNALFKEGLFVLAVESYPRAVELDPLRGFREWLCSSREGLFCGSSTTRRPTSGAAPPGPVWGGGRKSGRTSKLLRLFLVLKVLSAPLSTSKGSRQLEQKLEVIFVLF